MNVKRLGILASMQSHRAERQSLHTQAVGLCSTDLNAAVGAWQEAREDVRDGPLGEYMALAKLRYEAITSANPAHLVRRAMPREDKSLAFYNRRGVPLKLSRDIVVEDENGHVVKGYQVKAMSELEYLAHVAKLRKTEGAEPAVYPTPHTEMIYQEVGQEAPPLRRAA